MKPTIRPARPYFSSGPCAKRPGWSLAALEKALGELLRLVANQPAPDVRTFRRDVPAGIAHVVADLLERRPERRPQGAVVLADRLAALVAHLAGAEALVLLKAADAGSEPFELVLLDAGINGLDDALVDCQAVLHGLTHVPRCILLPVGDDSRARERARAKGAAGVLPRAVVTAVFRGLSEIGRAHV